MAILKISPVIELNTITVNSISLVPVTALLGTEQSY